MNALVTGAAHRLGKAITMRLAQEGFNIALHYYRAAEEADKTLKEITSMGRVARAYPADLRSYDEIREMFSSIERDFQHLDLLINSAAIMQRIPFALVTPEDWTQTIDLNLRAAFFCTQFAVQRMKAEGGVVINIADTVGRKPWPDFPVHSISKAAIEMLTKVSALAFAPDVRVNAIAPGPVLKPDEMPDARWVALGTKLPVGHTGRPDDICEAVVFLLNNPFITGEILVVDGGDQLV